MTSRGSVWRSRWTARSPAPGWSRCSRSWAGRVLDAWAYRRGITLAFIQPGKPTQNAFIESFNSRLRDECLNAHWFVTVTEAQLTIEHWRDDYNTQHPHGSLGRRTPSEFAAQWKEVTPV